MAPGDSNNRQTGTKPKTKPSKKNTVPQEIVQPTKRDLQQQLNVLVDWATNSGNNSQQNLAKQKNNRTPGERSYEFDNLTLQDNSRFIPVRPIIRKNHLNENSDTNEQLSIGVVLPSTPNSVQLNANQKHVLNPVNINNAPSRNLRSPISNYQFRYNSEALPQSQFNLNKNSNQQSQCSKFEDKINQINEYIRFTSNLITSVQNDNLHGPRPQSVQSINTNNSLTPVQSFEDIRVRTDNKNMQSLKEQQQLLLRLQQSARQQLAEMEELRSHNQGSLQTSFDTVEQVQDNVGSLMDRMRLLSSFIQNQNELGQMLGIDNEDVLADQMLLQNKFDDLRSKKGQLLDLVSEINNMNVETNKNFTERPGSSTSSTKNTPVTRLIPVELERQAIERNIPIELTNQPAPPATLASAIRTLDHSHLNGAKMENDKSGDQLQEKINEIAAMKAQLKRLQDMMNTVHLIEEKTGRSVDELIDEDDEANEESEENTSVISQLSDQNQEHETEQPPEGSEHLNDRVETLQQMTKDLKAQARSIAIERDRLKQARNDIQTRQNNVIELQQQAASTGEKITNQVSSMIASNVSSNIPSQKERDQLAIKADLEAKKKELENISKMTENIKKNTDISKRNDSQVKQKLSSVSSLESLRNPVQQPPVIPPPPAAVNVINVSASKHSGDSGVITDVIETGSCQSSSNRSYNMVPPMPDLANRGERFKKATQIENQDHPPTATNLRDRSSPWPAFPGAANMPSSSNTTGPQSPHFNPYVTGSELHDRYSYNYPNYSNLMPTNHPQEEFGMCQNFNTATLMMLMNSIQQCNQLLWIQQREINNLNNAVLLLQERILNAGVANLMLNDNAGALNIRAESMPPSNNAGTSSSIYRARSEQPTMSQQQYHPILTNNIPPSTYQSQVSFNPSPQGAPSTSQFNLSQQIQRNNNNLTGNSRNVRNLRHVNINTNNNSAIYETEQQPFYDQQISSNNFMSEYSNNTNTNNLNNNTSIQHQQQLLNNLNSNLNNIHQNQQQLNNQVLPGNRANNYWDNFRSYSRQNLLSNSSCKSNEESYASNNINNQIQRNNSNINNYNNLLDSINTNIKCLSNFHRNNSFSNVNQMNQPATNSEIVTNPPGHEHIQMPRHQQSHQPQHHHQPLNQSNSIDLGELQFHTNPINLGLANKVQQHKSSGNKKYSVSLRQHRDSNNYEQHNLGHNMDCENMDLNLASASSHDSKSTSKLFEALKENVYQEVKNLITANESRPDFLIQLFRELQLISSDPLRQRTLQSNQYIEVQEEGHVNNIGSNNLLTQQTSRSQLSNPTNILQNEAAGPLMIENQPYTITSNIRQQQQTQTDLSELDFAHVNQSTPMTPSTSRLGAACRVNRTQEHDSSFDMHHHLPNSEIINIIMTDIVNVINSVDYINDSVLCKIIELICSHTTSNASTPHILNHSGRNALNREEFLRHLDNWNRTDKDEFISNLENYLNNILLCSSLEDAMPTLIPINPINNSIQNSSISSPPLDFSDSSMIVISPPLVPFVPVTSSSDETRNINDTNMVPTSMSISTNSVRENTINEQRYRPDESSAVATSSYSSTTYDDLAEADQVCDIDDTFLNSTANLEASEDDLNLFK